MQKRFLLPLFAALLFAWGCNNSTSEKTPDTSAIKVTLQTYRLDEDLFNIDTNNIEAGTRALAAKYPDFLNYYLDTIMPMAIPTAFYVQGNVTDSSRAKALRDGIHEYLSYKDYRALEDTIRKIYPDTKNLDEQLTQAFKLVKNYFPAFHVPRIFYLNFILSNHAAFVVDSNTACVSLDMFLGPQYPYYASVGIPDYMAAHLRPAYLPVSLMTAVYESYHPMQTEDRNLLDQMIQKGKEKYFIHKVMPSLPDSVLFGFTGTQVNWCNMNEANLYNFFVQQNLLYNKDVTHIVPYLTDGPFAKGIGSATDPGHPTPGNVGTWLGYRIVRNYMEQNQAVSLGDLVNKQQDAARFLEDARYKPKNQ